MLNHESCGILIKQIHDALEKNANNALRARDLTLVQLNVLMVLCQSEEKQMSLKALEQILHVAQSTAAGIVKRLEIKGFVEAYRDPADLRTKTVRITSSGIECCQAADIDGMRTESELLANLTNTEKDILISLLKKVCANLS